MTEDFGALRRSMADLAEHGGDTDLYDRTLHASRRLARRRELLTVGAIAAAVLAIGLPVALADQQRSAPPAFTGDSPPSLPPSGAPPSATTGTSADGGAPKGMPDQDGCPVDAARLLTALRGSEVYRQLAPTKTLSVISCYATYALGRTDPVNADRAMVVFRYTEMTGKWEAVNAGTAGYCDGFVPPAVRPHLKRC